MDSGLPLIEISGADDSLLQQVSEDDITSFSCSPLQIMRSTGTSGSSLITMMKDSEGVDEPGCSSSHRNKENMNYKKSGLSNLSVESQKMKKNKRTGGYNLRKSLAWDKAFSTEEGVLNSLELSMISGSLSKLGGEQLSLISEEWEELNCSDSIGGSVVLQTLEENLFKKTSTRYLDDDKMTVSQASENNFPREDAKKNVVKAGRANRLASMSQKRLLNASAAKSAARHSNIPKVPTSKRDPFLLPKSEISMIPAASQTKSNKNAQSASVQKCTSLKAPSKIKNASNARKVGWTCNSGPIISQDTKKNMRNAGSERPLSVDQQSPAEHKDDPSVVTSDEVLRKGATKTFNGTGKNVAVAHKKSEHVTCNGQFVQRQAEKPSGLRMPSPSLRFFSENKASASNSLLQKNSRPSNLIKSSIPSSLNFKAVAEVQERRPPWGNLLDKAKQHDTMANHHTSSFNHPSCSDDSGSCDDGMKYEKNEKMEVRVLPGAETPKQCNIHRQVPEDVENVEHDQNPLNGNAHQEHTNVISVPVECMESDYGLSSVLPGNQDANWNMPEISELQLQSCLQKDVAAANQCTDSHDAKDTTIHTDKIAPAAHEGSSRSTFESDEPFVVMPFHDCDQEVQQGGISSWNCDENLHYCGIFHKLDEDSSPVSGASPISSNINTSSPYAYKPMGQAEVVPSVEESHANYLVHVSDNLQRPSCMRDSGCGREQNQCVEKDKYVPEAVDLSKEECFMPTIVNALSREEAKEDLQICNSETNMVNPDMSRESNSDRNLTLSPMNLDGPVHKVAAVHHMPMTYHAGEKDRHIHVIVKSCNTDLDSPARLGQSSKSAKGWNGEHDPSFIIRHAVQSCNQLSVNNGGALISSCERHASQVTVGMDKVPALQITTETTLDSSDIEQQILDNLNVVTTGSIDGIDLIHTAQLEATSPNTVQGPVSRRATTNGSIQQPVGIDELDSADEKESSLLMGLDELEQQVCTDQDLITGESRDGAQLETISLNREDASAFIRASTSGCVKQLVGIEELDATTTEELTSDASRVGSDELQQQLGNDPSLVIRESRESIRTVRWEATSLNSGKEPAFRRTSTSGSVEQLVEIDELGKAGRKESTSDASRMEIDELKLKVFSDLNIITIECNDGAQPDATIPQRPAFRRASTSGCVEQLVGIDELDTANDEELTSDASKMGSDELEQQPFDDPNSVTTESNDGREIIHTVLLEKLPASRIASTTRSAEQLVRVDERHGANGQQSTFDASQIEIDEIVQQFVNDIPLVTMESKDRTQLEATSSNKVQESAFRGASTSGCVELLMRTDELDIANEDELTLNACKKRNDEFEQQPVNDLNSVTTEFRDGIELIHTSQLEVTSPNGGQGPAFRGESSIGSVEQLVGSDELASANGKESSSLMGFNELKQQVCNDRDLVTTESRDGTQLEDTRPNREQEQAIRGALTSRSVEQLVGSDGLDTVNVDELTSDTIKIGNEEHEKQLMDVPNSVTAEFKDVRELIHLTSPNRGQGPAFRTVSTSGGVDAADGEELTLDASKMAIDELEQHIMDDPNLDTPKSKDGRELTCTAQLETTSPNRERGSAFRSAFRMASTSVAVEQLFRNAEIDTAGGKESTSDASVRTPQVEHHRDSSSTCTSHCEKPSDENDLMFQPFQRSGKDQNTDTSAKREIGIESEVLFDESVPTDESMDQRLDVDKLDIRTLQRKPEIRTFGCASIQNGLHSSECEGIGRKEDDTKMQLTLSEDDKKVGGQVIRPPPEASPFSDEWLAAIEAAGEEILTLKTGRVQNSPPDKLLAEPGPWSPVKRMTGPFDCTKFTNTQQPNSE